MKTALIPSFALLLAPLAFGQANNSPPGPGSFETTTAPPPATKPVALNIGLISSDEVRELIRKVAENDIENDKKQHDYTYTEREEQHRLDGKGHVTSNESDTYEVMMLYGEQVSRRIAHNDKPLSEKENAKEEEKIQKVITKRDYRRIGRSIAELRGIVQKPGVEDDLVPRLLVRHGASHHGFRNAKIRSRPISQ